MDDEGIALALDLTSRLPEGDVRALATATQAGDLGLGRLRADTPSPALRRACQELTHSLEMGADPKVVAGALLGASSARHEASARARIDVVWTGPLSTVETSRLTSAVLVEIITSAQSEILLVGYAVHSEEAVDRALKEAVGRGVCLTLLLERTVDNPNFRGASTAFPGVRARRLAWPSANRPTGGAALHSKILVVDRHVALVGSANITGWALDRNLECGLLVRGVEVASAIHAHLDSLMQTGHLIAI